MNNHVIHQLPDYVLNLLPKIEREAVEQHTANCGQCQKALRAERQVGQMVRITLQTASQPANGRLAQFMPPAPAQKQQWSFSIVSWQHQLAVVALLVALFMGSFGVWNSHNIWSGSTPTKLAATATSTKNATATIAQQTSQAKETMAAEQLTITAVASPTAQAYITATPAPLAKPVAAISSNMATN